MKEEEYFSRLLFTKFSLDCSTEGMKSRGWEVVKEEVIIRNYTHVQKYKLGGLVVGRLRLRFRQISYL